MLEPDSFRTGEVNEQSATDIFASEWQKAKTERPGNYHRAYVDAIRSTTLRSCGSQIWNTSKFPKTSYDRIKFKAVARLADDQIALRRGEGPRSHVHALHVDKDEFPRVEYWEVDEPEPTLRIIEIDRQTELTTIFEF